MSLSFTSSDNLGNQGSPLSLSPYHKFMYALNSKESKRQYPKRLQRFLDFIDIRSGSIEENCNFFYEKLEVKKDSIDH
jgi:hypothetical protein